MSTLPSPTTQPDELSKSPTRQDFPDPTAAAAKEPEPGQVSDEDLSRFAVAYGRVRAIGERFAPLISAAPNASEAQKAQQKAAQMVALVVQDAGLSMSEYGRISKLLRTDPELRRKVEAAASPVD